MLHRQVQTPRPEFISRKSPQIPVTVIPKQAENALIAIGSTFSRFVLFSCFVILTALLSAGMLLAQNNAVNKRKLIGFDPTFHNSIAGVYSSAHDK